MALKLNDVCGKVGTRSKTLD